MGSERYDFRNVGASSSAGAPPPPYQSGGSGDWWKQNRRWVIPLGCLGTVAIAAGVVAFVGAIVFGVFGLMRSSEPCQKGLAIAKAHPTVQSLLGTPVEEGWYLTGNHQESGPSGHADLAVPLHGPTGKGTLYLSARKQAGEWRLTDLQFADDATGQRYPLLEDASPVQ